VAKPAAGFAAAADALVLAEKIGGPRIGRNPPRARQHKPALALLQGATFLAGGTLHDRTPRITGAMITEAGAAGSLWGARRVAKKAPPKRGLD